MKPKWIQNEIEVDWGRLKSTKLFPALPLANRQRVADSIQDHRIMRVTKVKYKLKIDFALKIEQVEGVD